jgi:hypothetical protein
MADSQAAMQKLLASGWKQGDPIPEWFIAADPSASVGPSYGTMDNPMQLSTMEVRGNAPAQHTVPQPALAGAGTGASAPPGVFASMDEEQAQMYAGMGELKKQRERAEELRDTEDAAGRYLNQGRTFVAAHPLEHLSVGLRRMKGKKEAKRIGGEQTKGRKGIIDLLRNKEDLTKEDMEDIGYA